MKRFGLNKEVINSVRDKILSSSEAKEIRVYGSRAMDKYREGSDLDLVIYGEVSFDELLKTISAVEDLNLPIRVDIITKNTIENDSLIDHIERVGQEFIS